MYLSWPLSPSVTDQELSAHKAEGLQSKKKRRKCVWISCISHLIAILCVNSVLFMPAQQILKYTSLCSWQWQWVMHQESWRPSSKRLLHYVTAFAAALARWMQHSKESSRERCSLDQAIQERSLCYQCGPTEPACPGIFIISQSGWSYSPMHFWI